MSDKLMYVFENAHTVYLNVNSHRCERITPCEHITREMAWGRIDDSDIVSPISDDMPVFELTVYPRNAVSSYIYVGSTLESVVDAAYAQLETRT